jgi:acyl-CoA thioesterase
VTGTTIQLDPSWSIGDKIHGGYLLSQVVTAALDGGDYPHPLGVSAHFASAPDPGAADVEIEHLRSGRRVGFMRASLRQGGLVRAEVLITAGTLPDEAPRFTAASAAAPVIPPPDECMRSATKTPAGGRLGVAAHLDIRLDPATTGWIRHEPTGQGVVRGWIRRADSGPIDPFWMLIIGDAPPPVTFDLGLRGWVPTITLDAHIRALPAPGWLIAEQKAQVVGGGWLDETCTLWDETGRLVASLRQLAGYREP